MDWTSIYIETGEEDLLIPRFLEEHPTAPRLSRLVSRLYHHHQDQDDHEDLSGLFHHRLFQLVDESQPPSKYSLSALYYLSINYILGVGCLGVPYAFARAGFILCASILITVTLLSYITVLWVAETGARLELSQQQALQSTKSDERESSEHSSLVASNGSFRHSVTAEKYEVIDLVSFYLGPIHKLLYQISLMALMYVGLLAYTQVFCGSVMTLLWGAAPDRVIVGLPQLLFAVMVVPLSCIELDEQVAVQSLMATVRFVAMFIMIGGSMLALWIDNGEELSQGVSRDHPPYWAPSERDECHMSYTACFSGFGVAFSTALFSQLFQHSVPGLLRPLRDQPDKIVQAPRVFAASLLTTCSFYLLLGTSAASYFGAGTKSSVNLNFANFTFGLNVNTAPPMVVHLLQFASNVVVIFPALDTISVFPLIANTLGNNLLASSSPTFLQWFAHRIPMYRHMIGRLTLSRVRHDAGNKTKYSHLSQDEKKQVMQQASQIATVFWRLIAALPPLVASLWATELSFSLLLAGVAGLYVAFYAPSLLQLASSRRSIQPTIFSGWYSTPTLAYPVLIFATFSLGIVIVQIRDAWNAMHDS